MSDAFLEFMDCEMPATPGPCDDPDQYRRGYQDAQQSLIDALAHAKGLRAAFARERE